MVGDDKAFKSKAKSISSAYTARIPDNRRSETGRTRTLARSIYSDRRDLFHKLQQLWLRGTGVSEQKYVDVATARQTVR